MSAAAVQITNAAVSTATAWKTLYFNLRDFRNLPTTRNHYVKTPEFSCNGHNWILEIYPGGTNAATEGYVSIFMTHRSEGSNSVKYKVSIIDKFGEKRENQTTHNFEGTRKSWGWKDFILRSDILNEPQNVLFDGALKVTVSIDNEPKAPFVAKNPVLKMIRECSSTKILPTFALKSAVQQRHSSSEQQ